MCLWRGGDLGSRASDGRANESEQKDLGELLDEHWYLRVLSMHPLCVVFKCAQGDLNLTRCHQDGRPVLIAAEASMRLRGWLNDAHWITVLVIRDWRSTS